jgi:hypothetical protein
MKRTVLCCGILVVAVAAACSLPALARQNPPPVTVDSSSLPPPAACPVVRLPDVAPAKVATIDDLLAKLAALKAQKASLERTEKETLTLLKEKLQDQKDRLKKLGVNFGEELPAPVMVPVPAPAPANERVAPAPASIN